jgi:hypothetical protein
MSFSRQAIIQDAKKIKIDLSRFRKKEDTSILIKSDELDRLYEKYRSVLEIGDASLIAKTRSELISFKCRLGGMTH